jgi:hypothetical protein
MSEAAAQSPQLNKSVRKQGFISNEEVRYEDRAEFHKRNGWPNRRMTGISTNDLVTDLEDLAGFGVTMTFLRLL